MPCYNSEAYVITALESVLKQSYSNWELVAINDGSTDRTVEILNCYSESDNRILVLHKENGGYVSAVNKGLEIITGDYFLLLGSDDYLSENLFLEIYKQIKEIGEYPDSIAFRTRMIIDGELKGINNYTEFDTICFEKNINLKEYSEKNPQHSAILFTRDTSKMFKTKLLGVTRYYGKFGIAADGIFSMINFHKAASFLAVPIDGYFWTLRTGSVSSTTSIEKKIDTIINWQRFFAELLRFDTSEITSQEKEYLITLEHLLVELSMEFKTAVKYKRLIKENIRLLKHYKNLGLMNDFNTPGKIVSLSPPLFSVIYKLRNLFKR